MEQDSHLTCPINLEVSMNMKGLIITLHARKQFLTRLKVAYPQGVRKPDALLQRLLQQAKPAHINLTSFINRKTRNGEDADYYAADMWRFVVIQNNEGKRILTTCELRDYFLNQKAKAQEKLERLYESRRKTVKAT